MTAVTETSPAPSIRAVVQHDYRAWRPLWDGYNAFYGRHGDTALPEPITELTWQRFLDPAEPMHALVAEQHGALVGLAHYLYHRSMTKVEPVCYLSDLFTPSRCAAEASGVRSSRPFARRHGLLA